MHARPLSARRCGNDLVPQQPEQPARRNGPDFTQGATRTPPVAEAVNQGRHAPGCAVSRPCMSGGFGGPPLERVPARGTPHRSDMDSKQAWGTFKSYNGFVLGLMWTLPKRGSPTSHDQHDPPTAFNPPLVSSHQPHRLQRDDLGPPGHRKVVHRRRCRRQGLVRQALAGDARRRCLGSKILLVMSPEGSSCGSCLLLPQPFLPSTNAIDEGLAAVCGANVGDFASLRFNGGDLASRRRRLRIAPRVPRVPVSLEGIDQALWRRSKRRFWWPLILWPSLRRSQG